MNYKFSIKIAALLATFTGTSVGPTSLVPSDWLASASAQPPIVSPDQAQPRANSNMLAPIVPPVLKPGEAMPWKVDASKYQSAIDPAKQHRPALVNQAPLGQYIAPTPQVRQAVGSETDLAATEVQPATAVTSAPVQGQVPNGFSSAGIPLYGTAPATAPFAAPQPAQAPVAQVANAASSAIAVPITAPQGSGTRSAIGSGFQPGPALPPPPVISPGSDLILGPASGSGTRTAPGSVLAQEPFIADPGFVASPVDTGGGCSTCETGGAVGCESGGGCNCGPNGCFNADDIASRAGLYGSVGEARYYGHLEVLIMDRQDGEVVFTPSLQLGGFDADVGYRATFGERFDAINGREFSYWGTGQISNSATLDNSTFPLDQVFQTTDSTRDAIAPFGFFTQGDVLNPSTLIRPTEQSQSAETFFHAFEANRVRWAWDVFKSFAGIRYIYVSDRYDLNSTATVPVNDSISVISSGTYTNLAQNHLIGPHIGGEWFYDVGYRLSASVNLKGGIYANLNEVDTRLFRDGDAFVDAESENTSFASSLEFGIHAHYQISPRGRFRAGFNILHLEDVATVTQNFPAAVFDVDGTAVRSIGRGTGNGSNDNDDLTFTGFSFGLEFFR